MLPRPDLVPLPVAALQECGPEVRLLDDYEVGQ